MIKFSKEKKIEKNGLNVFYLCTAGLPSYQGCNLMASSPKSHKELMKQDDEISLSTPKA